MTMHIDTYVLKFVDDMFGSICKNHTHFVIFVYNLRESFYKSYPPALVFYIYISAYSIYYTFCKAIQSLLTYLNTNK